MAETIFIGVAWPYANGPLHLGHIAGAYVKEKSEEVLTFFPTSLNLE